MTSMAYHIDHTKPEEGQEVILFGRDEDNIYTHISIATYEDGELWFNMLYHDAVKAIGEGKFKHWMPVPSLQHSREWRECVSCGGPAQSDMCGFCLEEE